MRTLLALIVPISLLIVSCGGNPVPFFALDLAEAAAYYRLGDKRASDVLAARVEAGSDTAAAVRASTLRGLIADETDNVTGLDDALVRLAHPVSDAERADADELEARRDLRNAAFISTSEAARRAADLRRMNLDYRGMARALSVQLSPRHVRGILRQPQSYICGQDKARRRKAMRLRRAYG